MPRTYVSDALDKRASEIYEDVSNGMTLNEMGQHYGCNPETMGKWLKRRGWATVYSQGKKSKIGVMCEPHLAEIKELMGKGYSLPKICDRLEREHQVEVSTSGLGGWLRKAGHRNKTREVRTTLGDQRENIERWYQEGVSDGEIAKRINKHHDTRYVAHNIREWRESNGVMGCLSESFQLAYMRAWV